MELIAGAFIISIAQLQPHPHNPRGPVDPASVEELAASIKEKGILEPLLVVPIPDPARRGYVAGYRVVAGHRRLAAAKLAGIETVPVISKNYTEDEQEEVMLVENLQRADLTPLQEAMAFQRIVERGATLRDVVRKTGVGLARVQSTLQILKLSQSVQELFRDNMLPITCVRPLLNIANPAQQHRLAAMVAERRLSVGRLREISETMAETEGTDKAVEKGRKSPQKPKQPVYVAGKSLTRAEAVTELERLNGTALTFTNVRQAMEGVCGSCGMSTLPNICAACPLPQFLSNLIQGASDGDGKH